MTSLLTNTAAMVALQTLNDINMDLNKTNNRVSTGLRISQASDSAAYWAIATTTSSDNGALRTVTDALAIGKATLDVAYSGLESVRENLQKMKELLVSARQPGVNRDNIQTEISGLQADMLSKANASVINEQNFLSATDSAADNLTKSVVASFVRDSSGNVSVSTIDLDLSVTAFTGTASGSGRFLTDGNATPLGILDIERTATNGTAAQDVTASIAGTADGIDIGALTDSADDLGQLENYIVLVDQALEEVIEFQNVVGVNLARAESQESFLTTLIDANDRAVGALVDADMEEESTKLRALQTQQQLSIQSLSIANSAAQNVLTLFR